MDQFRNILPILVTLGAALVGAYVATKLHVKAGALVGALFAVSLLSISTGNAYLPNDTKLLAQLIAGIVIGASVSRKNLKEFKQIIIPSLVFLVMMILIGLLLGTGLYQIFAMDWLTAMFTTVPGGMTEMTIISLDMGADVAIVVLFQLVRLFSTIMLAPILVPRTAAFLTRKKSRMVDTLSPVDLMDPVGTLSPVGMVSPVGTLSPNGTVSPVNQTIKDADLLIDRIENQDQVCIAGTLEEECSMPITAKPRYGKLAATFLLCCVTGITGYYLNFPGGALTFSMLTMIACNLKFGMVTMPVQMKRFAQYLSGAYIGCQVTASVIARLPQLLLPLVFVIAGFFILSLFGGYLIHRIFKVDLMTALFSSVPGGASDMALISLEYDAAGSQVALFHTVRLIGVIAMAPPIIRLLSNYY